MKEDTVLPLGKGAQTKIPLGVFLDTLI